MQTLRRLRFALIARGIALAAVLCLLGVQQGAAFHGLSHLADEKFAGTQKHLPHAKGCDKCLVYAEVSGAGPTSSHATLQAPTPLTLLAPPTPECFLSLTIPVYSARAPPASV